MKMILTKKQNTSIILQYFIGYSLLYQLIAGFLVSIWIGLRSSGTDLTTGELSTEMLGLVNTLISLLVGLPFLIYILYKCREVFKRSYSVLKKSASTILIKTIVLQLCLYATSYVLDYFIQFVAQGDSANQQLVTDMVKSYPLASFFGVVIFAPIVEEIVFREVIFKRAFFKKGLKYAIIVSSFWFGLLHVVANLTTGDWLGMIHILTYFGMSVWLCIAYYKSEDVIGSISLHFLNNLVAFFSLIYS